jgi:hypothetical protein
MLPIICCTAFISVPEVGVASRLMGMSLRAVSTGVISSSIRVVGVEGQAENALGGDFGVQDAFFLGLLADVIPNIGVEWVGGGGGNPGPRMTSDCELTPGTTWEI